MVIRKILESTLSAGSTSISFTDTDIPNSLIRVYNNKPDVFPIQQVLQENTLTLTYSPQTDNIYVAVEIVKQGLDIVDNLTSTDADKALSAKQGNILNGAIEDLAETVAGLDIPVNITDLDDVTVNDIQVGQVLAWNGTEFVNVEQSGGGSSQDYSTTETVIGKWIDNTDVYKCVVTGLNVSMPSVNNWSGIFCDSLNIKDIIDCQLFDASNSVNVILLNIEQIQVLDGGIRINRTSSVLNGRTVTRAIITYIKNS